MSRKDYIAISDAIKMRVASIDPSNEHDRVLVYQVACSISVALQNDNSNFDRQRFLIACGF